MLEATVNMAFRQRTGGRVIVASWVARVPLLACPAVLFVTKRRHVTPQEKVALLATSLLGKPAVAPARLVNKPALAYQRLGKAFSQIVVRASTHPTTGPLRRYP